MKLKKISPYVIILIGFLGIITLGTILLLLPFSTVDGYELSFIDALFTSTSAVCVTGLVPVESVSSVFTLFGKIVILFLIQVDGLGFITLGMFIFSVLGLGRFGLKLVEELNRHDVDIIALDSNEVNVSKAGEIISNAYICDITSEAALRELGIENVDHAIVAVGSNLQVSIMATIILKEFGIKRVTVRVDDDYYINVIMRLGATDIVSPQKLAGIRLANKIVSDSFIDYFNISSDFCIVEIKIQEHVKPITIQELNPRNNYNVNLLLIHRKDDVFSAKASDELLPNDTVFVFGDKNSIAKFDSILNN